MVQSPSQLSLPSPELVSEHVQADADQNQRPHAAEANEIENVKIVEQKQNAQANQNDCADGTFLAPGLQRVGGYFSTIFSLSGLHGFEGAVENEASQQDGKHGLENAIKVAGKAENAGRENRDVNQAPVVLTLV